MPKNPVIKPTIKEAEYYESLGDFDSLIKDAIKNTNRITIDKNTNLDLALLGFTVKEALDTYKGEIK